MKKLKVKTLTILKLVVTNVIFGLLAHSVSAELPIPTEHKGIEVKTWGEVSSASLSAQINLSGYKLQLREVIIQPGGQIAKHDHATRPGIVKVVDGSFLEVRPGGNETVYSDNTGALLEENDTEHWVFNTSDKPVKAYICGIAVDE